MEDDAKGIVQRMMLLYLMIISWYFELLVKAMISCSMPNIFTAWDRAFCKLKKDYTVTIVSVNKQYLFYDLLISGYPK